jgi:hypothetical protein
MHRESKKAVATKLVEDFALDSPLSIRHLSAMVKNVTRVFAMQRRVETFPTR